MRREHGRKIRSEDAAAFVRAFERRYWRVCITGVQARSIPIPTGSYRQSIDNTLTRLSILSLGLMRWPVRMCNTFGESDPPTPL